MNLKRLLIATSLLCASLSAAVTLKPDAPTHYTIQNGDSLWNIAKKYTDDPWSWKQLWKNNRQIANPNKIYPGDELSIVDGKIVYKRNFKAGSSSRKGGMRTVKLTPQMKEVPIEMGIPVISYEDIKNKTFDIEVIKSDEIKNLPYIVGFDDKRLLGTPNMKAFVKGDLIPGKVYNIYNIGKKHTSTDRANLDKGRKGKPFELGTELNKTGEITIISAKDGVSTGNIKSITFTGVADGQVLLPKDLYPGIPNLYFEPKPAPQKTEAKVLAVPLRLSTAVRYDTVVLDQGLDAGLEMGDVLLAQTDDYYTNDPKNPRNKIKIPGQASGLIMIYKVFDRMSLGMVIESTKGVKVGNMAVTPYSNYLQD